MRTLLHFGLFGLALAVVGQASADDGNRRGRRQTTIVVAPELGHSGARPVRAPVAPAPPRYAYQRTRHQQPVAGLADVRRELRDAQRDYYEISRIVDRWELATRHHDLHAQRNAERRADQWIAREIEESSAKPGHDRYVQRLHALRRELRARQGGHAYGRGARRFVAQKARVLGDLVELSEHQLCRAGMRARGPMHLAFSYR